MTDLNVTINLDGAAFLEGDPAAEVSRILERVVYWMRAGAEAGTLADINGNGVGSWSITNARATS